MKDGRAAASISERATSKAVQPLDSEHMKRSALMFPRVDR